MEVGETEAKGRRERKGSRGREEWRKEEEDLEKEAHKQTERQADRNKTHYTQTNKQTTPNKHTKARTCNRRAGGFGPINTSLEQLCCVVWFPFSRGHSCHTHAYSRFIYTNYIRLNVVSLSSEGWVQDL